MFPKFKKHFFINRVQSQHFQNIKEILVDDEVIIQIDFAENFAIFSQDEIQEAHFSYSQVTIFTVCVWTKGSTKTFSIISDDLTHDKYCVWTFLRTLLDTLMSGISSLKRICIFSDGCTSQFKNKYVLSSIILLQTLYGIVITWTFFATSH